MIQNLNLHYIAVGLTALLLLYHQVTTSLSLFPWNDTDKYSRNEIFLEAGFNGLLMGMALICVLVRNSGFPHWYPLCYFPFLLFGECMDWWIPYFSEPFAKARKSLDYDAKFSRTLKLIPHKPGKRTPDANHIVLHFLTLLTTVAVYCDRLLVHE